MFVGFSACATFVIVLVWGRRESVTATLWCIFKVYRNKLLEISEIFNRSFQHVYTMLTELMCVFGDIYCKMVMFHQSGTS